MTDMSIFVTKHGETIPKDTLDQVSVRYHRITKAINQEFWNSDSEDNHSLYVGSYGRHTAIDTSDIDMLMELPREEYDRYDWAKGNGQSRLLQAVKSAITSTYPRSDIHADGQVVVVSFSDGMKFEVLPAFIDYWGSYSYPDTNMGGNWKPTNPKAEQNAMREKNRSSNGLLADTCKHIRRIKSEYYGSYHLSGIVIDSFVYSAIGSWRWTLPSEQDTGSSVPKGQYEETLLKYYNDNSWNGQIALTLYAPGSNQQVDSKNSMECLGKVLRLIVG